MSITKLPLFNVAAFYIAHTMPLYFCTFALPVIMREQKVDLVTIGYLGILLLPFALKFLWAPLIDRFSHSRFGTRRSWLIPTQLGILLAFIPLFGLSLENNLGQVFACAFILTFFCATHDIATAGFVYDQFSDTSRRWGNFAQVVGTTLGSFLGGAVILFVYQETGWNDSITLLLIISFLLFVVVLKTKEIPIASSRNLESPSLRLFWKNKSLRYVFFACILFRCCEGLVMGMQQPFLVDQNISMSTIGWVMGLSNITLGLISAACAAKLVAKIGEQKLLFLIGMLRSLCYGLLFLYAFIGIQSHIALLTIVIINMAIRLMEMVALYTLFMRYCRPEQAGTDFAIFSCAELLTYMGVIMVSGYFAEFLGYDGLFLISMLLSIPSVFAAMVLLKKA